MTSNADVQVLSLLIVRNDQVVIVPEPAHDRPLISSLTKFSQGRLFLVEVNEQNDQVGLAVLHRFKIIMKADA